MAKDVAGRAGRNNISIVSAGVAFYVFLAMVPLLAATVLTYGLIATPAQVTQDIGALTQVMPEAAAGLFADQLESVVETSAGKKGVGLLIALGFALFGARNGAGSVLTALNISHGVAEARSLVRGNLAALAITAGGIVAVILAVLAMGVLTALTALIGGGAAIAGTAVTYLFLFGVGTAGAATLFRYAPNRPVPSWKLVLPGAILASIGWFLLTLGFGIYVANFGNYNATYGSLSAVVVLLTWLYLSAIVLLLGAELNASWGDRRPGYRGLEVG
ncbi:YihY/virulence factor BrkB family protein [Aurantiacibacter spongiae]|uniref:YihY/virulence factor BrkB family protein n=2 Tax=Aurantiacibacter spongiae TaxID=2488860 RepID=A0A3N5CWN1_9SPHN|nr:YihY/virulence factor BrkB family protein [Aurantiacibacter spongiae]